MKARIIEQPALVYSEADLNLPSIAKLTVGSEVELGGVKKKDGKEWVAVTLSTGQRGYLPGETRIYQIKQATLLQGNVNVYAEPSAQSTVIAQYKKNTRFYLTNIVKRDNKDWVEVRDLSGTEGFIEGQTKIKVIPESVKATKATGSKNMLYGALWCIGGIVVTAVTYSAASSGGTYIVAWGAILFGGLQFLQGLYQYLTSPN
jgi:hypothetical protein